MTHRKEKRKIIACALCFHVLSHSHVVGDLTVQVHDLPSLVDAVTLQLRRRHLELRRHRPQGGLRDVLRVRVCVPIHAGKHKRIRILM